MAKPQKRLKVIWHIDAQIHLKELIAHLSERYSPKFISLIKSEIERNTKLISLRPRIFPQDILKENNDGKYRYFNVPAIRIAYKIEANRIIVLRVRHQSQEPLVY